MKKELFIIIFADGEQIKEMAFSLEEAEILAQAERIKQGKSYTVKSWAMAEKYSHCSDYNGFCETCFYQSRCHAK